MKKQQQSKKEFDFQKSINFQDYQEFMEETAKLEPKFDLPHTPEPLQYYLMKVMQHAGEIANVFKDFEEVTDSNREKIFFQMLTSCSEILFCTSQITEHLGSDLESAAKLNIVNRKNKKTELDYICDGLKENRAAPDNNPSE